jgi:hypothetical protein
MYAYQNPKLSQYTRQQIFNQYQERVAKTNTKGQVISQKRKYTQANLALQHGVSRQTISKIISWGKQGVFFPKTPVNHRYKNFTYWNKKVDKLMIKMNQKAL